MQRVSHTILGLCVLFLAACNPAFPQATQPTDTADTSTTPEVQVIDLSQSSGELEQEMDAWANAEQASNPGTTTDDRGSSQSAAVASASAQQAPGGYQAYELAVLADGQTKVLFFSATWCPICKVADEKLTQWYAVSSGQPLATYKVDYDTETALKSKYGVTYQHTFVKVDGQGNLLQKLDGPNDQDLRAMIGV